MAHLLKRGYEPINMKYLLILLLVFSLVNCSSNKGSTISKELSWLLNAVPEREANKAIKSGDLRYLGIVGISIQVPLFNRECINEDRVRFIQISDLVDSYEQIKLQAIAPVYAESYNYHMLQYYKRNKLNQCGT